ncbi:PTS transporter subunit IIC [Miniphocaeibacter massiliensis]|uniref:PTS transporter subunit IIC n=1 Tax=Miniphocaeibacter massiliensis TaxID=2041841 RepID=UPI000C1B9BC0|nr:PTS sugar transporter subunit IIC [Miniphocaeibacter massiliensis]
MKEFLKRKNIILKPKTYFIDAMGAMAYGLFASLLVGTILNTVGQEFNIKFLTKDLWPVAQEATGAAIAVAIAYALKAPDLVLFSSAVVGIAGYKLGGPVGVYISTIFAVEFGKIVSKETKLDIVVTPVVTVLVGVMISKFIGPPIDYVMIKIGEFVMFATTTQPIIMGILVSVVVGIVLTLPISSAALCMMLSLSGIAGGAATIGCCCQMVGFAVISFKENGLQGFVAQGLGTSMLQMPNIMRNWKVMIPSIVSSAILGPVATVLFKMENTPLGSGMGTSGIVGQIGTFNAMSENYSSSYIFSSILLLQIFLPAVISFVAYKVLYKINWIKDGDLKLPN